MKQANKPHHHGNLREALVLAGLELIDKQGADALTLRKCAIKAGVSHAAPAHHFDGLKGLRAAIIAHGHDLFAEAMREASIKSAPSHMAHLDAVCRGYISFATAHTSLFKFMFQPHDIIPDDLNDLTRDVFLEKTNASYQILRDACAPFGQSKITAPENLTTDNLTSDNLVIETMVWSLVHGYAMLFCGKTRVRACSPDFPEFSQLLSRLIL
ncbi:MAG: TetR/AcrR family transcriptional regulator [Rhizobiales bacterium]|nr:TetR/AcrR family transcriptional regulator [Hyphomicrobiales bacterium]